MLPWVTRGALVGDSAWLAKTAMPTAASRFSIAWSSSNTLTFELCGVRLTSPEGVACTWLDVVPTVRVSVVLRGPVRAAPAAWAFGPPHGLCPLDPVSERRRIVARSGSGLGIVHRT